MEKQVKQGLLPQKYWVKDVDGNLLKTYRVGKWMVTENMKTEHYNDGTPIPIIEDNEEWRKTKKGAMCYYNNDHQNKDTYGALYNGYTVDTGKLALQGWTIHTDEGWKELEISLGMDPNEVGIIEWRGEGVANRMKEILEVVYAGCRNPGGAGFCNLGTHALWWCSSVSGTGGWYRQLYTSDTSVARSVYVRSYGLSVRCVRELTSREIDLFDNLTISEEKSEEDKVPDTVEKREFTMRERIFLRLLLLALEFVSPLHFASEIDEIKKML